MSTTKKAPEGACLIQGKDTNKCQEKQSFVFYRSFEKQKMPDAQRLEYYDALFAYALRQEVPDFHGDLLLECVWECVKPQIDANHKRFLNGHKGGPPIGNQNARKQPKNNLKQPNVNDNDNVDNYHYPYNPCKTFEPVLPGYHPMTKEDLQ